LILIIYIINRLTYVYITRYFNGEIYNYINEACEIIWEITTILDNNLQYTYSNIEEVLESKTLNFRKVIKFIINK